MSKQEVFVVSEVRHYIILCYHNESSQKAYTKICHLIKYVSVLLFIHYLFSVLQANLTETLKHGAFQEKMVLSGQYILVK